MLDSTFLTAQKRASYFDMMRTAFRRGQPLRVQVLEFPLNVQLALERQKQRQRQVPEFAIRKMAKTYNPFALKEARGLPVGHIQVSENDKTFRQRA